MESERRLVERVLTGDVAAFRELVARYDRLVRHVVQRLVDDPSTAEEVCQDVFVRVYRGLPNFRSDARLSTWIGRIAFNTAARHMRGRRALARAEPPERLLPEHGAVQGTTRELQLDALIASELRAFVHTQLSRLPAEQRVAITLYHLDGLPIAEVAEIMEMPENTVKSHLFRGRKALKELLQARLAHD